MSRPAWASGPEWEGWIGTTESVYKPHRGKVYAIRECGALRVSTPRSHMEWLGGWAVSVSYPSIVEEYKRQSPELARRTAEALIEAVE